MSRKKPKPPLRYFTFSPEMIHVTQQAMKLLVPLLARAEGQSEKVEFAIETVQQVKSKLDAMRASVGSMCLTGFDYNEKIVIAAAIQLYMADLRAASVSAQREKDLRRCQRIMRFALDPGEKG
jgi:hypothetical protein